MQTSLLSLERWARRVPLDVWLSLFAVYVIWGSTYLALRIALISFPPFLLVGTRFVAAGVILFVYLRLRGMPMPTLQQWGHAAIVAVLLLGVGNGGVTFAEQWVSSSLAAAVIATAPLWTAIFSGMLGQWPGRTEWIGIAIGLAGVVLINLEGDLRANPLGAAILVLAPIGWAFGSVLSRKLNLPAGLMGSAAEMLTGGPLFILLGLARGERFAATMTLPALSAWLYLVVFGSLVAFSAYMFLIRNVRPALATSYAYVNPVVALFLGVVLAGEVVTWIGLAGIGVILVGVMFITLGRARASQASSPSAD